MARTDGRLTQDAVVGVVADVAAGTDRVVALGGGGDSALLLYAATSIDDGMATRGLFVDHGLTSSALLRKGARAMCEQLGVELTVVEVPVADGPNLEERARDARYAALDAAIEPGEVGLLGHSLDDQAETVVMRLAHGAGARGLSGMPNERGRWHRPFLGFTRSAIRTLAAKLEIGWEEDLANTDRRFERVRVRTEVVPALAAAIDGARTGLSRSAGLLAADDAALEAASARIPVSVAFGCSWIPKATIVGLPAAVASRAVRRACALTEPAFSPSAADVARIIEVAESGSTVSLPGGRHAFDIGSHIGIGFEPTSEAPLPIPIGDSFTFNGTDYSVVRGRPPSPMLPGGRYTVISGDHGELQIRGWQPGDRIDVGTGHTPVAEVLRAAGIRSPMRPVSPVITHDGTIAAVVGVRTAAWAQASPDEPAIIIDREVMQ